MLKPGDQAPLFELPGAIDGKIEKVALAKLRSEIVVLFFYPHDFSFICPTEVSGFHKARELFQKEDASLLGASIDDAETHVRWARELGGCGYPLLADEGGRVARAFGVFDDNEHVALRATFVMDRQRKITYSLASAINVGRSVSETLRVVQAIRTGRLCPADWTPGAEYGPNNEKY